MDITTIGFDLAKTVFQVHGADGEGRVVLRRKLRRGKVLAFFAGLPSCLVGMEACASAHYWARELQALGHKVRLIPPQYVRPFVKTNKNDAADAEAICEAVTRPTMRFAPAKSAEQQSVLMLHRARELLVRQRTMVINALRGHCAEFGLIVAQGALRVEELVAIIEDPGDERLPPLAREALGSLVEQLCSAQARIKQLEVTLLAWHRSNQASRRLATIPGVGVITATALVATIGDGAQFRSGRQLSAWLGLVPRQHSSGGKDRLGRISKRGDGYIRAPLRIRDLTEDDWLNGLWPSAAMLAPGFPGVSRAPIELFPLQDRAQALLRVLSHRRGEAVQLDQTAHVVGEVLQPYPSLCPRQPDTTQQRPAHVVALGPENMLDAAPNGRAGLVALLLALAHFAMDPAPQPLLLQRRSISAER